MTTGTTTDRTRTAADRLALGGLPWRAATQIVADACRALEELHTSRSAHGDVRPETLALASDNSVTLVSHGAPAPALPSFASPEHCAGRATDARSDLYSLGATYFALLTGRPPFEAAAATHVADAHRHQPVPNVRAIVGEIPLRCAAVIRRAMEKDPADRYPSASVMHADLEAILAADDRPIPLPPETLLGPPRRNWRRWAATAVGAAVSVIAAFGAYSWQQAKLAEAAQAEAAKEYRADPTTFLPRIRNSVGMTLAQVPPGAFIMGDPLAPNARPHPVRITRPFHVGVHEVTQAQYKSVTSANPSQFSGDDSPVECVSWEDARAFCEKLSDLPAEQRAGRTYRLPTEAEWEYACRAGTHDLFPFPPAAVLRATNTAATGMMRTMPVGAFPANQWGLHEFHGNVWEWCADWYEVDFYLHSPRDDPKGPDSGGKRVTRGGSWNVSLELCRAGFRSDAFAPDYRGPEVGFRVLCEVTAPGPADPRR